MHFQETVEGEWRIYAGALESPLGDGYTAAAAVQHSGSPREAWRDDALACGHRWPSAEEALRYALGKAREAVRGLAAPGCAVVAATPVAVPTALAGRGPLAPHALSAPR
jgi:hypothetical protein